MRLLLAAALLAAAASARADVAPPPEYKDPCVGLSFDERCLRCAAPEFKGKACYEQARQQGFSEACRGWSYSMQCPPDAVKPMPRPTPDAAPATPPARPDAGTSATASATADGAGPTTKAPGCAVGGGGGALLGLGLLGLIAARRR